VEALQRLQPLDYLFILLWAALIAWGYAAGVVRQVMMTVVVYAALALDSQLYKHFAQGALNFFQNGRDLLAVFSFIFYVLLFVLLLGLGALASFKAYPRTRFSANSRLDGVLGALVGVVWGTIVIIVLVAIMRYFTVLQVAALQDNQRTVDGQLARSEIVPTLQVIFSPIWKACEPWFPDALVGSSAR
jgi:uncharacterized membrane protein required for colicin V production